MTTETSTTALTALDALHDVLVAAVRAGIEIPSFGGWDPFTGLWVNVKGVDAVDALLQALGATEESRVLAGYVDRPIVLVKTTVRSVLVTLSAS